MKRHQLLKKPLILFYTIAGAGMLGHGLFRPILPIFARRLGATGLEVGLLTSGFMLARAVMSFFIGRGVDITGRRDIFTRIGFFFVFVIALSYFFVQGYYGLLFLRFCQGLCSGLIWPPMQVMVAEEAPINYRTRALSLYQITGRIGGLLSRALLSLILILTARVGLGEIASFRVVFLFGGVILFAGFIETLSIPGRKIKIEKKGGERPPYPLFILGFVFGALMGIGPISIVYLNERFHINPVGIAVLLLFLDVVTIGAMYATSYLSDRIGFKRALLLVSIPCLITTIYMPFASVLVLFLFLYFIARMSISSFMPISRAYATSINSKVGMNIGTLNMSSNLGAVFGPVIAGLVYDKFLHGFKIAGYSFIALLIIPAILFLMFKKNE